MKILGGNKSYTLTINMMKKDFLIWRMCLCNSWKHPKLASKSIKTQFKIWKFRLARVTPWKIVGGSKSYNLTINMKKKKISNLDNLLMQLMETSKATQHTIKNLEIQFVKLAKEVAKFFVTRE